MNGWSWRKGKAIYLNLGESMSVCFWHKAALDKQIGHHCVSKNFTAGDD
jgi:hypothetical protein